MSHTTHKTPGNILHPAGGDAWRIPISFWTEAFRKGLMTVALSPFWVPGISSTVSCVCASITLLQSSWPTALHGTKFQT